MPNTDHLSIESWENSCSDLACEIAHLGSVFPEGPETNENCDYRRKAEPINNCTWPRLAVPAVWYSSKLPVFIRNTKQSEEECGAMDGASILFIAL
jgi:hypothetical protein